MSGYDPEIIGGDVDALSAKVSALHERVARLDARIDELEEQAGARAEKYAALEGAFVELESRVHEAGRRALFIHDAARETAQEHDLEYDPGAIPTPTEALASVGRALLFDPETPDPERGSATSDEEPKAEPGEG